jgi:hypothetical protein
MLCYSISMQETIAMLLTKLKCRIFEKHSSSDNRDVSWCFIGLFVMHFITGDVCRNGFVNSSKSLFYNFKELLVDEWDD